jgi:hypothetical protein
MATIFTANVNAHEPTDHISHIQAIDNSIHATIFSTFFEAIISTYVHTVVSSISYSVSATK